MEKWRKGSEVRAWHGMATVWKGDSGSVILGGVIPIGPLSKQVCVLALAIDSR